MYFVSGVLQVQCCVIFGWYTSRVPIFKDVFGKGSGHGMFQCYIGRVSCLPFLLNAADVCPVFVNGTVCLLIPAVVCNVEKEYSFVFAAAVVMNISNNFYFTFYFWEDCSVMFSEP